METHSDDEFFLRLWPLLYRVVTCNDSDCKAAVGCTYLARRPPLSRRRIFFPVVDPTPLHPPHTWPMEEAQSSYCCVASAYVVLPCASTTAASFAVSSSSDRYALIDDDVSPRLVRHLYNILMCSTRVRFNDNNIQFILLLL